MNHQHTHSPSPHVPSDSSERWSKLFKSGGSPIVVAIALFLSAEALLGGTLALRWKWESRTYDKRDMYRVELVTLAGSHVHHDFFPFIGLYKTDRTVGRALIRRLSDLIR